MNESRLARRIHRALYEGKGIRLTALELEELVLADDAMVTRLTNDLAGWTVGDGDWILFKTSPKDLPAYLAKHHLSPEESRINDLRKGGKPTAEP